MTAQHFRALADSLRHERPEPEGFADPDRRQDYYDQRRMWIWASRTAKSALRLPRRRP